LRRSQQNTYPWLADSTLGAGDDHRWMRPRLWKIITVDFPRVHNSSKVCPARAARSNSTASDSTFSHAGSARVYMLLRMRAGIGGGIRKLFFRGCAFLRTTWPSLSTVATKVSPGWIAIFSPRLLRKRIWPLRVIVPVIFQTIAQKGRRDNICLWSDPSVAGTKKRRGSPRRQVCIVSLLARTSIRRSRGKTRMDGAGGGAHRVPCACGLSTFPGNPP
jgi:hypothetical protein